MRVGWRSVGGLAGLLLLIVAVAAGALWLLSWAIVQNDADRTLSAYQDQP